jgi:hypothetical protein
MRIQYTDAAGKRQRVEAEFDSVRQALYFAVNTGWLLDATALSIEAEKPKSGKAKSGVQEAAALTPVAGTGTATADTASKIEVDGDTAA